MFRIANLFVLPTNLLCPLCAGFLGAILLEDITRNFFWVWCRTFEGCAVCNLLLVPFFIPTTADEYGVSFPSFMLQTVKQSFLPVLLINTYTFVVYMASEGFWKGLQMPESFNYTVDCRCKIQNL